MDRSLLNASYCPTTWLVCLIDDLLIKVPKIWSSLSPLTDAQGQEELMKYQQAQPRNG